MADLPRRSRFLLFSVIAWACSFGLLLLIERVSRLETRWIPPEGVTVSLWGFASVMFGVAFFLVTLAGETRALRSQPFGLLILAKSFVMVGCLVAYFVVRGAVAVALGQMTLEEAWSEGVGRLFDPIAAVILLYIWITSISLGLPCRSR